MEERDLLSTFKSHLTPIHCDIINFIAQGKRYCVRSDQLEIMPTMKFTKKKKIWDKIDLRPASVLIFHLQSCGGGDGQLEAGELLKL